MSSKNLVCLVAVALLGFAGAVSADSGNPTLLYGTPTADVLPVGTLAVSADMSLPLAAATARTGREENAAILFSPLKHLDVGLTAYTEADYVLDAKYSLLESRLLALAAGVCDVGIHGYVSPMGHDSAGAWPDWQYSRNGVSTRTYENLSAFAVADYRATTSIHLHAGIGRGRFVGYGSRSKYLNTDILAGGYHQWALGLFGGAEVFVIPQVAVVAEASGRDLNAGIRASFSAITATIAWTKVEGPLLSEGDEPGGRFALGLSYRFHDWSRLAGLLRPRKPAYEKAESALPPSEVSLTLAGATVHPNQPTLKPILFDWDSWTITPTAAASLASNAEILLDHPQQSIVVTGHAAEESSPEANFMLSGKRAFVVLEQLKALGVPQSQMRCRSLAEAAGSPPLLQRVVSFEAESGN